MARSSAAIPDSQMRSVEVRWPTQAGWQVGQSEVFPACMEQEGSSFLLEVVLEQQQPVE
jgi:hypothetical protein